MPSPTYGYINGNLIQISLPFLPPYHRLEKEFVQKGVRYLVLELSSDKEYFFPVGTSQSMAILEKTQEDLNRI